MEGLKASIRHGKVCIRDIWIGDILVAHIALLSVLHRLVDA